METKDDSFLTNKKVATICIFLLVYHLVLIFLYPHNGETEFNLSARGMLEGFFPYQYTGGHKTPGTSIFLALVFSFLPYNVFVARFSILLINIFTSLLLWKILYFFNFKNYEKWITVFIFLFAIPCYAGTDVRSEQFVGLLGLFSFYIFLKKELYKEEKGLFAYGILGITLFLCFFFKQTGLTFLLGYFLFLLAQNFVGELKFSTFSLRILFMSGIIALSIYFFFSFYDLIGWLDVLLENLSITVTKQYSGKIHWYGYVNMILLQIPIFWFLSLVGLIKGLKDFLYFKRTSPQLLCSLLILTGLLVITQNTELHYPLFVVVFMAIMAVIGLKSFFESHFFAQRMKLAYLFLSFLLLPSLVRVGLNFSRFFYFWAKVYPAPVNFKEDQKNPLHFYTVWHELALAKKIKSYTVEKEKVAIYYDHRYYWYSDLYPYSRYVMPRDDFDEKMTSVILYKGIRTVIVFGRDALEKENRLAKLLSNDFPFKEEIAVSPAQVVVFQRPVPPPLYSFENYF